jgi:DNA-binding response OmpR family regulator
MTEILLIEDDPALNHNITESLSAEGMRVETAFNGHEGEKLYRRQAFSCVVLDISLPGLNGLELCKRIREADKLTPVIMLTAFDEIGDKVKGYESGADDYLTKPFYMQELILRIQALTLRRRETRASGVIRMGEIAIDTRHKKVSVSGKEILLTSREYQIIMLLVEAGGEPVSKKTLIREIWGGNLDTNANTVEVFINFLRNKIDKPFGTEYIRTRKGYGYYFNVS